MTCPNISHEWVLDIFSHNTKRYLISKRFRNAILKYKAFQVNCGISVLCFVQGT